MNPGCGLVHEQLVEHGGREELLDPAARGHLAACASCRAAAGAERGLNRLLEVVVPDVDLEPAVMAAIGRRRQGRRLAAAVPVAASLLLAVVGVTILGGVPGDSVLALLPGWSAMGWLGLLRAVGDWSVLLVVSARTLSATAPAQLSLLALAFALAGLAAVAGLVVRWRTLAVWRRAR